MSYKEEKNDGIVTTGGLRQAGEKRGMSSITGVNLGRYRPSTQ